MPYIQSIDEFCEEHGGRDAAVEDVDLEDDGQTSQGSGHFIFPDGAWMEKDRTRHAPSADAYERAQVILRYWQLKEVLAAEEFEAYRTRLREESYAMLRQDRPVLDGPRKLRQLTALRDAVRQAADRRKAAAKAAVRTEPREVKRQRRLNEKASRDVAASHRAFDAAADAIKL